MCGSRKYPYPHCRGSLEIQGGGESEPKLEFPEGWRVQNKKPPWGEYGYFLEQHNMATQGRFRYPGDQKFFLRAFAEWPT